MGRAESQSTGGGWYQTRTRGHLGLGDEEAERRRVCLGASSDEKQQKIEGAYSTFPVGLQDVRSLRVSEQGGDELGGLRKAEGSAVIPWNKRQSSSGTHLKLDLVTYSHSLNILFSFPRLPENG